jgi:hypothetical protein
MAETKHKSKYTAPKDLEKSQKPKPRKDLKDYTLDDKDGKLNPHSTKEKQANVLRKTDKPVVDDGKMDIKWTDKDRLYKKLEDGEYDPKDAAKKLKKRQDDEEKDVEDVLKDKIENLTREQKERLVREYIRRKIVKVLQEQTLNEQPAPDPNAPVEDPAAAPTDPAADPNAAAAEPGMEGEAGMDPGMEDPMAGMSGGGAAAPPPPPMDPGMTTPPADPNAAPTAPVASGNEVTQVNFDKLNKGGNVTKTKELAKIFNQLNTDVDPEDKHSFYKMVMRLAYKEAKKIK